MCWFARFKVFRKIRKENCWFNSQLIDKKIQDFLFGGVYLATSLAILFSYLGIDALRVINLLIYTCILMMNVSWRLHASHRMSTAWTGKIQSASTSYAWLSILLLDLVEKNKILMLNFVVFGFEGKDVSFKFALLIGGCSLSWL
jgi:hypothetical protein